MGGSGWYLWYSVSDSQITSSYFPAVFFFQLVRRSPLFFHAAALFTGGVEEVWVVIQYKIRNVVPPVGNHWFVSCQCGSCVFLEQKWEMMTKKYPSLVLILHYLKRQNHFEIWAHWTHSVSGYNETFCCHFVLFFYLILKKNPKHFL